MMLRATFFMFFLQVIESAEVTRHLKSKVALQDTNVTFICSGKGENPYVVIDIVSLNTNEEVRWLDLPEYIPEYHISVTGSTGHDGEKTFYIKILAELANNETEIQCKYVGDFPAATGPVYLYVANDTLGEVEAFQQPRLSYNTTTITVSWSPPWSHLVNNYTVTMNNLSTNTWMVDYLDNDETTWKIHNSRSIAHPSQCDRLRLFVTAFTDIGETKSKIVEAGFPIELTAADVNVDVLQGQNGEIKVEIHFEAPIHCASIQMIYYNYTIFQEGLPNKSKHYGPIAGDPGLVAEGFFEKNSKYTLEITYWDSHSSVSDVTITKNITTNFTESLTQCSFNSSNRPVTVTSPSTIHPTVSNPTSTPTISTTSITTIACNVFTTITTTVTATNTTNNILATNTFPSQMQTILISVIVILFVLLAAVFLVFSIMICWLQTVKKKRSPYVSNVAETEDILPMQRERSKTIFSNPSCSTKQLTHGRRPTVPQVMATNPIYEESQELYERVCDLRSLGDINDLEIPNQIPIPHKQTLDSPGVKAGVQLSLDKHAQREIDGADNNNTQYITMQSARYVKSPTIYTKIGSRSKKKDLKRTEGQVDNEVIDLDDNRNITGEKN